ncbi:MAG: chemotaxis protein CheW [Candidatus Hydrogenedentes bacterium]|nr:chemotaxis protein CheW [Candidatus Hydrogenedentota bacterium]
MDRMDDNELRNSLPWLIFSLDRQSYAINGAYTREMVNCTDPIKLPYAPDYVRGAISLRGSVMPLVDLRLWIGLSSARKEIEHLVSEMHKREQDHRDWLTELEASIREERPFTRATDPHKCAFGKWYDSYHSENPIFREVLRKFDAPHKAIHGIAVKALAAAQDGRHDLANSIVEETRNTTLREMIDLFGKFRHALVTYSRETAIILENNDTVCAVAVDSVDAVEQLDTTFDSTAIMFQDDAPIRVPYVGKRKKDGSSVLVVDVDVLFSEMRNVCVEHEGFMVEN